MKILDYVYYNDFGHEWYFQVLSNYPKFALLDLAFQWDEFPSTNFFPFLVVSMGPHHLLGFTFRWKAFEINCDIIDGAPRNFEWYRGDRYESID